MKTLQKNKNLSDPTNAKQKSKELAKEVAQNTVKIDASHQIYTEYDVSVIIEELKKLRN